MIQFSRFIETIKSRFLTIWRKLVEQTYAKTDVCDFMRF